MKKLQALRSHLLQAVPDLQRGPEKLLTFIEDGAIRFHRGPNYSHQYTMPARIIITDYRGEVDAVIIPLLEWISRFEPDADPEQAIQLEAEILNNQAYDLMLTVTLKERVVAKADCEEGRIVAEHRMPEYEQEMCPATAWELYVRDPDSDEHELVATWGDSDD